MKKQTDMQKYNLARQTHVQLRKQNILDIASKLFLDKGLSRVTIPDIMKAANVSKTTLYRYFENFDEIAFEVNKMMMERIFSTITTALDEGGDDKIKLACAVQLTLIDNFYVNMDAYKYTGMFDNMYSEYYPTAKFAQEQLEMMNNSYVAKKIMIKKGVPKEIRNRIVTSTNVVMSFLYRLASRGQMMEKHQGISVDEQLEEFRNMIRREHNVE